MSQEFIAVNIMGAYQFLKVTYKGSYNLDSVSALF